MNNYPKLIDSLDALCAEIGKQARAKALDDAAQLLRVRLGPNSPLAAAVLALKGLEK